MQLEHRYSGNSTVVEEYIDVAFVILNCVTLLMTSSIGLAANVFVMFAVYRQKSLQTSNNALLVNLAVLDGLRCAIDCPILFAIVVALHRKEQVDEFLCNTQVASFSFSCCIQLLTLACISAERHQAIAQPFKNEQRRKRITVLIPLTWTLALFVATICVTYVKDSPVYVKCRGEKWDMSAPYDTFGLYVVMPLWAISFCAVIGFYSDIFKIVRNHNRKIFDKGTTAVSRKKEMKEAEGEKTQEPAVVETELGKGEPNEPVRQIVAGTQHGTPAESYPCKKDSALIPLISTKDSTSLGVTVVENKNLSQNITTVTKAKLNSPVVQVKPSSPDAGGVPDLNVVRAPDGFSKNVTDRNKLEDRKTQTCDASSAMARQHQSLKNTNTKPKPSTGNATSASLLKAPKQVLSKPVDQSQSKSALQTNESSNTPVQLKADTKPASKGDGSEKPQSTSNSKTEFEEKVQTNEEPKQRRPEVSSAPPVDPKQVSGDGGEKQSVVAKDQACSLPPEASEAPQAEVNADVSGAVCIRPSKANKDRANKKKESKMAKRSGYIILTFLLFWLPLITSSLVNFTVFKNRSTQNQITLWVEFLSISVACATSLSDPIIYAAVNPQFRTEFYRLRNQLKSRFHMPA